MNNFTCDLCDLEAPHEPSLADDHKPELEICNPCQLGLGLANFFDDGMEIGRTRVQTYDGQFPQSMTQKGKLFTLSASDRMTATYTID